MPLERVALTGASGMLGRSLLRDDAADWLPLPRSQDLDLRDRDAVLGWFEEHRPKRVIHTAAMTAVDACEETPELAFENNRNATRHVAQAAARIGARLVYISTDYVFDGQGESPWRPDSKPSPINRYGASKLAGEEEVRRYLEDFVIARVGWLYGPGGPSFLHTMARLGKARQGTDEALRIVSDQIGAPTSTLVLAQALRALVLSNARGIFHIAPSGNVSWFEYARFIFQALELEDVRVEPCTSAEFQRPAARPQNSRLDTIDFDALRLYDLGTWQAGVEAFIRSHREELLK